MLFLKINKFYFINLEKARNHKYIDKIPDGKGGWIYIYSYNFKTKFQIDLKEFGFKNSKKIIDIISKTRNSKIEHSYFFDEKGNDLFYKKGDEHGVSFNNNEINKIKNSRLMIHNHPNGGMLSSKDFLLLLETNIKEMRAYGIDANNNKTNFFILKNNNVDDKNIENFKNKFSDDLLNYINELNINSIFSGISPKQINNKIEIYAYKKFFEYNKGYYKYGKY
jgi:hypothetical protein